MTARAASMPFPARLRTELQLDPVLLSLVLALLLGGFVILASASISISENAADNPFFYLQRQLLAAVIGGIGAATCLFIPMQVWRNLGPLMLLLGLALLVGACGGSASGPAEGAPAPSPFRWGRWKRWVDDRIVG